MLNSKIKMNHFITLKDIPATDLRKIVNDAKKRKEKRKKFNTLDGKGIELIRDLGIKTAIIKLS